MPETIINRVQKLVKEFHSEFHYIPEASEATVDHWKTWGEFQRDGGGDCEDGAWAICYNIGEVDRPYSLWLIIGDVEIKSKKERHAWLAISWWSNNRDTFYHHGDWTNGYFGSLPSFYHPISKRRWNGSAFEPGEVWGWPLR